MEKFPRRPAKGLMAFDNAQAYSRVMSTSETIQCAVSDQKQRSQEGQMIPSLLYTPWDSSWMVVSGSSKGCEQTALSRGYAEHALDSLCLKGCRVVRVVLPSLPCHERQYSNVPNGSTVSSTDFKFAPDVLTGASFHRDLQLPEVAKENPSTLQQAERGHAADAEEIDSRRLQPLESQASHFSLKPAKTVAHERAEMTVKAEPTPVLLPKVIQCPNHAICGYVAGDAHHPLCCQRCGVVPGEHGGFCERKPPPAPRSAPARVEVPRSILKSCSSVQRGRLASDWYKAAAERKGKKIITDKVLPATRRSPTPSKSKHARSAAEKKSSRELPPLRRPKLDKDKSTKVKDNQKRGSSERVHSEKPREDWNRDDRSSARGSNWRPEDDHDMVHKKLRDLRRRIS